MESPSAGQATTAKTPQYVGFELAGQVYAFRIDRIREIVMPSNVSRLPDVPAYVDGVSNLRGSIIPIINLRVLLGLESQPPTADSRVIVVSVGPRIIGCLVDAVSRVMRIAFAQIQAAPDTVVTAARGSIEGFARVADDLCILLDADSLLDPARLEEVHGAGVAHLSIPPVPPGAG